MSKPATERELRRWVAKQLRVEKLEDPIWDALQDEGLVRDALDPAQPDALSDLVAQARRYRRLGWRVKNLRPPKERTAPAPEDLVTEAEWRRAEVFSAQLGRLVGERAEVRRFRQRALPTGLLAPDAAQRLLNSDAARYFPLEFFQSSNIPLGEHSATFFDSNHPPGGPRPRVFDPKTTRLLIEWQGGLLTEPISWEMRRAELEPDTARIPGVGRGLGILPFSLFDQLRALTDDMVKFYDWPAREAVVFILTGHPPFFHPLFVQPLGGWRHDHRHLRIQIEVEPWVSSRTVTKAFRHIQKLVLGAQGRPMSNQNMEMFDFVSEQVAKQGGVTSWGGLLKAWNASKRGAPYSDRRRFRRDYYRTLSTLMFPRARWPSAEQVQATSTKAGTSRARASRSRPGRRKSLKARRA